MVDVVITYGWNRIAYNSMRSLRAHGLKVAVGDSSKYAMSLQSRLCSQAFVYKSFYADPEAFVDSMVSWIRTFSPKVYMPMHEETFIVAKYAHKFKDLDVIIPIGEFEKLRLVHKKDTLAELARQLDIPTPKTVKPASLDALGDIWEELSRRGGRVVIKTLNTNSAKGVSYAFSKEGFRKQYCASVAENQYRPEDYPLVQEYINGVGVGVSQLYNRGQLRASFTHRRVREKNYSGGTSTSRISCHIPVLEEYSTRLLSHLGWHGVAMTEYKYDPQSNQGWLIDVNPRFWGSLALAIRSGIDFPALLYRMAVDGDVAPCLEYREGVVVRWVLGDLLALMSEIKARKSLRPLGRFVLTRQDGCDDWFGDDPRAFVFQFLYYSKKMISSMSVNPTDEAMLDIDAI